MTLKPITIKRAKLFISRVHRRLPKIQGAMWGVSVESDTGALVGVAVVGWPARLYMERGILCVLRVAVLEGHPNACSMLYGACARTARAMGATGLVTYTHEDEPGTSLRAAGWVTDGLTDGGEWDRPSRPRQKVLFPEPKRRWWASWSR